MTIETINEVIAPQLKNHNSRNVSESGIQQICESIKAGLTLIAGRPRMGCSTFAVSLAMMFAKEGKRVLYCAHKQQAIPTIIYSYLYGELQTVNSNNQFSTSNIAERSCDIPLYYADMSYPGTLQNVITFVQNNVTNLKIDYIFVDGIQDLSIESLPDERYYPEEVICRNLRQLSMQFNLPIVATTYLNRQPELRSGCGLESKKPQMADFRGGDLTVFARQLFFLFRPEYYHVYSDDKTGEDLRGILYVDSKGGADGLSDEIKLAFRAKRGKVEEL